jgi:hypothetical protein
MPIDLEYYERIATGGETDHVILKAELGDLVKEVKAFLNSLKDNPDAGKKVLMPERLTAEKRVERKAEYVRKYIQKSGELAINSIIRKFEEEIKYLQEMKTKII